MNLTEIFLEGQHILEPLLTRHGFQFSPEPKGKGSGGYFVRGQFIKGDRRLEIHFRSSLGFVTYHVGALALSHEGYMRSLLGNPGGNRYPGFSNDPLDGFRGLAFDLEHFCGDFLAGDGEEFRRCVDAEAEYARLTGMAKLAQNES
jgi:hypothetical protein